MTQYIPQKDALCLAWLQNFQTRTTANPGTFGLTAAEALTISNAVTAFDAAYALVTSPSTKTKSTVADKDAMKAAALATVRPYAQLIRRNAGVSNQNKLDLGLTIADASPTPVQAPQTSPVLTVLGATPLQHTLRYVDQNTPTKRGKPDGVIFLELFFMVSSTPITNPEDLTEVILATKNPVPVDFQQADAGKLCYYAGRWVTRRGLTGPWSSVVSFTVANS